jgi:predicted nuclease with TOPRIM domain
MAPIKHTCPDIDKIINKLTKAKAEIDLEPGEISDLNRDRCQSYIDEAIDGMEDIRNDNSTLRDWGENMEVKKEQESDRADEAENENAELKQEITLLEAKVKYLEDQISDWEHTAMERSEHKD